MALTLNQQLLTMIDRSKRIIIAVPTIASIDALASSRALARSLVRKGKTVNIVCEGWNETLRKQLAFLASPGDILPKLERLKRYAISIDANAAPVNEVSYEVDNGKLLMYLQPQHGVLRPEDVKLLDQSVPVDWMITVGAPDMDSLGTMAIEYRELLSATPLLNIDHAVENEHFGQWQLIDVTSPSIAEIIFRLHDVLGVELIDEEGATLLLTGIIAATRSFTMPTVTSQTLTTASRLMTMGGRREEIVKNLYWKRSVGSLKLFGKLLSRLHHNHERRLAVAAITDEDLLETTTEPLDAREVAEEIFHTSPDLNILVILSPDRNGWDAFALSRRAHLMELMKQYKPMGIPHRVQFHINTPSVAQAQKELLEFLTSKIPATTAIDN